VIEQRPPCWRYTASYCLPPAFYLSRCYCEPPSIRRHRQSTAFLALFWPSADSRCLSCVGRRAHKSACPFNSFCSAALGLGRGIRYRRTHGAAAACRGDVVGSRYAARCNSAAIFLLVGLFAAALPRLLPQAKGAPTFISLLALFLLGSSRFRSRASCRPRKALEFSGTTGPSTSARRKRSSAGRSLFATIRAIWNGPDAASRGSLPRRVLDRDLHGDNGGQPALPPCDGRLRPHADPETADGPRARRARRNGLRDTHVDRLSRGLLGSEYDALRDGMRFLPFAALLFFILLAEERGIRLDAAGHALWFLVWCGRRRQRFTPRSSGGRISR